MSCHSFTLFHRAEYCGTPPAKARSDREYKVCLRERVILRLLDGFGPRNRGHFRQIEAKGVVLETGDEANRNASCLSGHRFDVILYTLSRPGKLRFHSLSVCRQFRIWRSPYARRWAVSRGWRIVGSCLCYQDASEGLMPPFRAGRRCL